MFLKDVKLTSMSMFMQGSRSPLFRVGVRAESSWYTVNVNTWSWMEEGQKQTHIRLIRFASCQQRFLLL